MNEPLFSIVIPYKQRLDNLRLCFASLAEQTLDATRFEVVIGAMEYCQDFVALCREFADRLTIVSVLSDAPWQITRARNLALRQVTGQVTINLDADMLLPPRFLEDLHRNHFASGGGECVIGQMIGYGNNNGDVDTVEVKPFEQYRSQLAELDAADVAADMRLGVDHVIGWAFAWTALIALRTELIREHHLYFDEDFRGYGVEDLEWARRIAATGTGFVMARDVYGIHLPHPRNVAANRETEMLNYRRFVRKWPEPDVELAAAFGDFEANGLALEFRRELSAAAGGGGRGLAVALGTVDGRRTLVVGIVVDSGQTPSAAEPALGFDADSATEVLGIAGLSLPYPDNSIEECRVLPAVARLSDRYLKPIIAEAERVAKRVKGSADV